MVDREDADKSHEALAALEGLGRSYEPFRERFGKRHAELLGSIGGSTRARLVVEPTSDARFTVSVCAIDCVGVLAIITGLFAARRIDIRNGDVFTIRPPKPAEAPAAIRRSRARRTRRPSQRARIGKKETSGRILDVFDVATPEGAGPDFWPDLEAELSELVSVLATGDFTAAVERVALGVSESFREMPTLEEPLLPISIALDNEAIEGLTELRIQGPDTPAFLFQFANSLTLLDVDIDRVEIRTLYGEARDTFWVTDAAGGKIDSPQRVQELKVATALIKQFSHLLPRSANPAQALQQFSKFVSEILRRPDWTATLEPLGSGDVLRILAEMMGVSRFLWEDFLRLQHENLFPVLSDVPGLDTPRTREEIVQDLSGELEEAEPEEAATVLNRCKDREMFRIDLRHITHRIGLEEFSAELTALAEAIIGATGALCVDALRERQGDIDHPWCICGAGKLGGRELGFASDIELIFVFDRGDDDSGEVSTIFEAFAQQFLKTLAARQNGVFEIDLRLRPHGAKGPLACTLDAFRSYYAPGGQAHQFERMALVKLRPVAGDAGLGERIEAARDAFVYSGEPMDLGNVRHLRDRQAEEIVRGGTTNAKFSPGGLVDVEYFVQARQIEAGQTHAEVRATGTLEAAARLAEVGALEPEVVERLTETYRFLRRVIDALRVVRGNAKDLTIPTPSTREFDYLARRLGYGSPERLGADLDRHMEFARGLWAAPHSA